MPYERIGRDSQGRIKDMETYEDGEVVDVTPGDEKKGTYMFEPWKDEPGKGNIVYELEDPASEDEEAETVRRFVNGSFTWKTREERVDMVYIQNNSPVSRIVGDLKDIHKGNYGISKKSPVNMMLSDLVTKLNCWSNKKIDRCESERRQVLGIINDCRIEDKTPFLKRYLPLIKAGILSLFLVELEFVKGYYAVTAEITGGRKTSISNIS